MKQFQLYFILIAILSSSQLFGQSVDDTPWEILMFQDNVKVEEVVTKFNVSWSGDDHIKGSGLKPFRRWEYLNTKRVNREGILNRFEQAQSFRIWKKSHHVPSHHDRSMTCPFSPTGEWKTLGPIGAVENYGIGRINAVAFHPNDANQLWAASPSGGIWISYDYGENWQTMTDNFTTLGFSDIAFNPLNSNTIYAATGDKDSGDAPSIGVIKSTDGGSTWTVVHSTSSRIHRLLIHPTDTSIIVAATSSGLYRSADAGTSWNNTLDAYIRHMEFRPNNPSVVYASEYATSAEFYRSTNSGSTWSTIALPAVANTPRRLAIGVTAADNNIVYLLGGYDDASNINDFAALYKSTNGGATFSVVSGTAPSLQSQYWYDWTLVVSPIDPNILFAGGASLDKSTNGGSSWSNNGSGVHVDHHFSGYHPITGDLFVASDGGVYITNNQGNSWNFVNKGMSIAQYYRLSTSDTEGDLLIAGAQDNGTHLLDDDDWDRVVGADGMECIINHQNPNIMYAESQRGNIRRSTNKGSSFNSILTPASVGESGAWVTPYVMHPSNPNILYAGYNSVHKTTNGGSSWPTNSGSLSASTLINLAISSQNPAYVYAGTSSSMWRTTNSGASWTVITSPSGYTDYVTVDPKDENTLYATSSFDVYKSTDGGNSWMNITGSLPSISMNCVVMQRGPNNPLYLGTDFGVYYIDDTLTDWILFSSGLPNVVISELEIDECQGMIRAATYGRGIWESPLYCTNAGAICCDNLQPKINPAQDVVLCASEITLSAVPGPYNYDIRWYQDGNLISGANTTTYLVTDPGDYTYQLIDPLNALCNSQLSNNIAINFLCLADSNCATLNPNTDNGPGNTTTIHMAGLYDDIDIEETASICVSVNGDFANVNSENFTIYDESNADRGLTNNISDCSGPSEEVCFIISAADFNQWNNDGIITITLDPISTAINPNLCSINEACARLYLPGQQACPSNDSLQLAGALTTGTYRAAVHIESDGAIGSSNNVIFESGDHIDLLQNFEVQSNGEFEAKITPCTSSSSSFDSRDHSLTAQEIFERIAKARLLD